MNLIICNFNSGTAYVVPDITDSSEAEKLFKLMELNMDNIEWMITEQEVEFINKADYGL
jgi:hypothetical protein